MAQGGDPQNNRHRRLGASRHRRRDSAACSHLRGAVGMARAAGSEQRQQPVLHHVRAAPAAWTAAIPSSAGWSAACNFVDAIERGEPPVAAEPDPPRPPRLGQCAADDRRADPAPRRRGCVGRRRAGACAAPARASAPPARAAAAAAADRRARAGRAEGAHAGRRAALGQRERVRSLFDFEPARPTGSRWRPASPRDSARLLRGRGGAHLRTMRCGICRACCGAATCLVFNDTRVIPAQLEGRAARRGSARPCTSARARATGAPSSATPRGCAKATGSTSARASPRSATRARRGRLLPADASRARSRSSCCSSAPGGCRCRPISPAGARPTRATATIIRPCSRARKARSPRRPPRSISRRR